MTEKPDSPKLIPPHGGYKDLQSYRMSEIVHDATVVFCNRFISRFSRTHDQMVQAARSGKQNIAEGSMASGTCSGCLYGQGDCLFLIDRRDDGNKHSCLQR
jgi:hypothetical protein